MCRVLEVSVSGFYAWRKCPISVREREDGELVEQTGANGKIAEENQDAVRLMTLHAVKGLEFPVVVIIGMNEGSIPHSRAWTLEEQKEERRLAYVGFTRAVKRLYLYSANQWFVSGESRDTTTSRFLDDLLPHLIR